MAETYIAKDGDTIDFICWKYYTPAQLPLSVEKVLAENRGIAAGGVILKAGTPVFLPDIKAPEATPILKIWG